MCSVVHASSRRTRPSTTSNAANVPWLRGCETNREDALVSEERALAALDPDALLADAAALVRVPSVTGDERAAVDTFAKLARGRGLAARTLVHDLAALRRDPGYPGEEARRSELFG